MMSDLSRREMLLLSAAGAIASQRMATGEQKSPATAPASAPSAPTVQTRMFWTWDHSTEWALNRPGGQTLGASNPYGRTTDAFIEDYTRLLQWCGKHHVDAVVVWGLLRDTHGGLDSARKLCDVANQQGVRLLCGVGLNAYGGVYYQGNSEFSLQRHLETHPDLYGVHPDGKKMIFDFGVVGPSQTHHACPSRKENQDFTAESLAWLFKNLPLGGVQIETGDTGVCQCARCKERRQHPISSFSWEDMAMMYPIAADAIRSVNKDALILCETYSPPEPFDGGPNAAPGFGEGRPAWSDACLAKFPDNVFVQWVCDDWVKPKLKRNWTAAGVVTPGRHRHVMRAHFGTYWGRYRGELAVDWIADMVQKSMAHGYEGISIFGEVSPFHTGAELNYLALENYGSGANPSANLDVFLRDVCDPLLGGANQAQDYLRYARLLETREKIPQGLMEIYKRSATLPPKAAQRWNWLANYLASFIEI